MSQKDVRAVWRRADAVCFDVDSTVCKDEGIDELAKFCNVGLEVSELTKKAMGGNMSFREALSQRLDIIKPSRQQMVDFIGHRKPRLSDGIVELVSLLKERGCAVYLVSGGFISVITEAAKLLSIPPGNIFCNRLKFYYSGEYAGFDVDQPTSDSGGKTKVVKMIKEKFGHKQLVMVGDGATDMETCPPADAFIGYGGNVVRESVKEKASWFITDFQELIGELKSATNVNTDNLLNGVH
ncbi:phosphoserine phosphatase-like isoform X2 [Gigantopelta aegis]|nr:phosphoserine phosphatase-like isoform X2 [Gigantopelta aegis]XP_041349819.1 phosphoserine phosphatase-like isoform X2 [Gigantopelta aegis]XP_041349820.1 phosphoserine phosphatase-like isoform X2 [Gigantopelta aegis]XP_041349821.1 phosphoserine phosphatase-like isoform X2 [Gigantopelta aegis]